MAHVIVVGCGNIGSHLVPHLARLAGIKKITLIDKGSYDDERNLSSQAIARGDLGKPKAQVQAARLRGINPHLQVHAIADSVEHLPLGILRAELILSCVDSRLPRMHICQTTYRLGGNIAWMDAGVDGRGLIARVNAYLPGAERPCLECGWSEKDYEALAEAYSCTGRNESEWPTNAPAALGALAASMLVLEVQKFLAGNPLPFGSQILMDAAHHRYYLTSFRRNPYCRFDHELWAIEKLGPRERGCSLAAAFRRFRSGTPRHRDSWLQVEGKPFVKRLICGGCGRSKSLLRLRDSLRPEDRVCPTCGGTLLARGWDLTERLCGALSSQTLALPLSSLGLRKGEVFTIGDCAGVRHFEITVTPRDRRFDESG